MRPQPSTPARSNPGMDHVDIATTPRRRPPSPGAERYIPQRTPIGAEQTWIPFRISTKMEKSPGTSTAKRESIREGDDDRYGDSVAEALGIPLTSKMLDFSYGDKSQLTSPEQSIAKQHSPKPKPSSNIPFRILDAPGLRNDFYANLVSWSKFSTHLIVGLGRDVHIWLPQDGARLANISRGIGEVTFVEFAYDSLAAIGRNDGTITFYDVLQDKELESFEHRNSVLCAVWCPNNCDVFVGDDSGEVLHLALTKIDNCYRYLVHQMPSLICHADQICGKVAK